MKLRKKVASRKQNFRIGKNAKVTRDTPAERDRKDRLIAEFIRNHGVRKLRTGFAIFS